EGFSQSTIFSILRSEICSDSGAIVHHGGINCHRPNVLNLLYQYRGPYAAGVLGPTLTVDDTAMGDLSRDSSRAANRRVHTRRMVGDQHRGARGRYADLPVADGQLRRQRRSARPVALSA